MALFAPLPQLSLKSPSPSAELPDTRERRRKAEAGGVDEAACQLGEVALAMLDTPAEERFDRLTRLARTCLRTPFSLLTVITPDRQWFKSAQGTQLLETPVEVSFCVQALRRGELLVLPDLPAHPDFGAYPVVCGEPFLQFYAGIPLRAPDGQWVGTLCVMDTVPRDPSPEEITALQDLARCAEDEIALSTWNSSELELLAATPGAGRASLVDGPTRCWSAAAILDILIRESARSRQHQRKLSVLLLRSDLSEPERARATAETLRRSLASYQTMGRLADDVLLVVLPELGAAECAALARKLHEQVEGQACVVGLEEEYGGGEALRLHLEASLEKAGGQGVSVQVASPTVQARSLGPFELQVGGEAVPASAYRTQKTRLLLAYLLGCPERRAGTDVLIEEFWPKGGESARNSLRGALTTLRSLMRPACPELDPITRDGQNVVSLSANFPLWSDLEAFQELSSSGREEALAQALSLYRGPYLENDYEDWALLRRDKLAEQYLGTARRLAEQAFTRGDFGRSAELAETTVRLAPERQDLLALLFRSWLRLGRPEQVQKRYTEAERELRDDFGVEPSLELVELYHRARLGLT